MSETNLLGTGKVRGIFQSNRRQMVLFVVVGLFNTAVGYGIYAGLLALGFEYRVANLGALVLSIPIGFKTQGSIVFKNPSNGLIFKFIGFWILLYWFNISTIGMLMEYYGLNAYAAGAVALFPTTALSFLLQKFFVFRRRH